MQMQRLPGGKQRGHHYWSSHNPQPRSVEPRGMELLFIYLVLGCISRLDATLRLEWISQSYSLRSVETEAMLALITRPSTVVSERDAAVVQIRPSLALFSFKRTKLLKVFPHQGSMVKIVSLQGTTCLIQPEDEKKEIVLKGGELIDIVETRATRKEASKDSPSRIGIYAKIRIRNAPESIELDPKVQVPAILESIKMVPRIVSDNSNADSWSYDLDKDTIGLMVGNDEISVFREDTKVGPYRPDELNFFLTAKVNDGKLEQALYCLAAFAAFFSTREKQSLRSLGKSVISMMKSKYCQSLQLSFFDQFKNNALIHSPLPASTFHCRLYEIAIKIYDHEVEFRDTFMLSRTSFVPELTFNVERLRKIFPLSATQKYRTMVSTLASGIHTLQHKLYQQKLHNAKLSGKEKVKDPRSFPFIGDFNNIRGQCLYTLRRLLHCPETWKKLTPQEKIKMAIDHYLELENDLAKSMAAEENIVNAMIAQ